MKYYNYQLIFELNRMVDIYEKDYKFTILKKALENIIDEKKRQRVFVIVNTLNNVCETLFDMCVDFNKKQRKTMIDNFFEQYLKYLQRYSFFIGDIGFMFKEEYRKDFQQQIYKHWSDLTELKNGIAQDKNFIEVFDEIHENCIAKYENTFVKRLGELINLYRAQRGKHFDNYDRMVPKEEYVRNKNRWNPEGVAFIYLGYDEDVKSYDGVINCIEKTCFEELRLKKDEYASVCKFRPVKRDAKIINLCYEDESYDEIEGKSEEFMDVISQARVNEILSNRKYQEAINTSRNREETIKKIITKEIDEKEIRAIITKETEIFVGNLIMKGIDEAVFLPVNNEEDPEFKAYIPFHYLANYLIGKGYSGILYRSTRMNKIGLKGKNLVLFNKADVQYVKNSMKVYYRQGETYNEITNNEL